MVDHRQSVSGFEAVKGAGKLHIHWDGPKLDLYSMAVLQLNLQEIIDRVGFWIVGDAGIVHPFPGRLRHWRGLPPWQQPPRFIKAVPDVVTVGSLFQEIGFMVANAINEPDIRAILQNLAASVVWAIGASGVKGVEQGRNSPQPPVRDYYRGKPDPVEVGPNIRAMVIALAESVPHGSANVEISSSGTTNETRVRISINNRS